MTQSIWVVDDDQSIRWVLDKALQRKGWQVRSFADAEQALAALAKDKPDLLVTDVRMDGMDGLELMKAVHKRYGDLPVIVMTAHSDLDSAVASYQGGAFEYLPKPFDIDEVLALISRALEHVRVKEVVTHEPLPQSSLIGEAPAMQEVFRAIGRLSQSQITVLINGESGTGKELVARALHDHSPRANKAFIALNMAAIPRDLMESELFGHEKGSFTGATGQRLGRFEQANGGTLFLDEIGDMPAETQTRLLRVLSDGVFYRVGGVSPIKVDVRIIAATHQNLQQRVSNGSFREDLFHRLNVIRIQLPPLRERVQDIPRLLDYYLHKAAQELNEPIKHLSANALEQLCAFDWPGNVRQLTNVCRWLTVMASGQEVLLEDLPPEVKNRSQQRTEVELQWQHLLASWANHKLSLGEAAVLKQAVPEFEAVLLQVALAHSAGRKGEAADLLGWGRNTITRKLKELKQQGLLSTELPKDDS